MAQYHTAQICLQGHVITGDVNNGMSSKFCSKCGEATITECPQCKTPIRGNLIIGENSGYPLTKAPEYCTECGQPYPWFKSEKN